MNWRMLEFDLRQVLQILSGQYNPQARLHIEVSPSQESHFFSTVAFLLAKIQGQDPILIAQKIIENWPECQGYRVENRKGFLYFYCQEMCFSSTSQLAFDLLERPTSLLVNPRRGLSSLRLGCLILFFLQLFTSKFPAESYPEIYRMDAGGDDGFERFAISVKQVGEFDFSKQRLILPFDLLNSEACRGLLANYGHAQFVFPLRNLPDRRWLADDLDFVDEDFERVFRTKRLELIWYLSSYLGADELDIQVPGFYEADNLYWLLQSVVRRVRSLELFGDVPECQSTVFLSDTAGRRLLALAMQIELQVLRAAHYAEVIKLLHLVNESLRQIISVLNSGNFHNLRTRARHDFEQIAVWECLRQLEALAANFSH